ncbi:unnamed protein product [Aphanomyces euteiches]
MAEVPIPNAFSTQPLAVDQYGTPLYGNEQPVQQPSIQHTTRRAVRAIPDNVNIRRDSQGRALCNKCNAPYPLPEHTTCWRCPRCRELNNGNVVDSKCQCCILL